MGLSISRVDLNIEQTDFNRWYSSFLRVFREKEFQIDESNLNILWIQKWFDDWYAIVK